MTRRSHAIAMPLLALASVAFLATTPVAAALYVITPLHLDASATEVEVGDTIQFNITPNADWDGKSYAGAEIILQYGYDRNENREPSENPDEPVGSDDARSNESEELPYVYHEIARIALDDGSRGAFTWTVPAEVDDHNVFVTVIGQDNETLGNAHIAVGDADPMMHMMRESGPAEPRIGDAEPTPPAEDAADDKTPATDESAGDNNVPAVGLLAAAGAVGLAALALRRRS